MRVEFFAGGRTREESSSAESSTSARRKSKPGQRVGHSAAKKSAGEAALVERVPAKDAFGWAAPPSGRVAPEICVLKVVIGSGRDAAKTSAIVFTQLPQDVPAPQAVAICPTVRAPASTSCRIFVSLTRLQ